MGCFCRLSSFCFYCVVFWLLMLQRFCFDAAFWFYVADATMLLVYLFGDLFYFSSILSNWCSGWSCLPHLCWMSLSCSVSLLLQYFLCLRFWGLIFFFNIDKLVSWMAGWRACFTIMEGSCLFAWLLIKIFLRFFSMCSGLVCI